MWKLQKPRAQVVGDCANKSVIEIEFLVITRHHAAILMGTPQSSTSRHTNNGPL
jgi:hypothetical protein